MFVILLKKSDFKSVRTIRHIFGRYMDTLFTFLAPCSWQRRRSRMLFKAQLIMWNLSLLWQNVILLKVIINRRFLFFVVLLSKFNDAFTIHKFLIVIYHFSVDRISPNDVQLATKLGVLLYTTGIVTKGIEKILEADSQTPILTAGSDLQLTIAV